ncbi:unnamed protein product [Caenorhabditis angaria]|uniref:Chromo domain-containing protein n=1 Tax=Caenorhabditis angaria TaxID=860376 RepID=A0A9P1I5I4_9PELO|nr:unnamed protein product [Caenorhabditis angaria]
MPKRSSDKVKRKENVKKSDEIDYEVERILDHVTFEHAYNQYYHKKDERYEKMFNESTADSPRIETYKYYYLIKWRNFVEEESTWESEENCLSMDNLKYYKKVNGLPEKCIKIRGNVKNRNLDIHEFVVGNKDDNVNKEPFGFYPEHSTYNENFGIVPHNTLQDDMELQISNDLTIWLRTDNTHKYAVFEYDMSFLSCTVVNNDSEFEKWQQEAQLYDKSYISSIIQHPKIVKMLDYYYKYKQHGENYKISYCYIYEWLEASLNDQISQQKMTLGRSKKMFSDILSILSLLHNYGIHQSISAAHIFKNGEDYKLGYFKNFHFFNDPKEINDKRCYSHAYKPLKYYGELDEVSLDIYALAVVLLESLTGSTVENIENDSLIKSCIEEKLSYLEEPEKSIISTILNSSENIHVNKLPKYRFSAKSLLKHPWLSKNEFSNFTKCYFLASYFSYPIEEVLFFNENEQTKTVIDRIVQLYFEETDDVYYQALLMPSLNEKCFITYVENSDVLSEILKNNKEFKLVIVPILRANHPDPFINPIISLVYFEDEFGAVPIVIESEPMDDMTIAKTVIEQAFPIMQRYLPFCVLRLPPEFGIIDVEYGYIDESIVDTNIKHSFVNKKEIQNELSEPNSTYNITQKVYKFPINTSKENKYTGKYRICEFLMKFGKMKYERECRFNRFGPIKMQQESNEKDGTTKDI